MNKLYEENSIRDIADAIREKGGEGLYKVEDMANAIDELPDGGLEVPEEAFLLEPNCYGYFAHGHEFEPHQTFLDMYGDKITTSGITDARYMFYQNSDVKRAPFKLNFSTSAVEMSYMFTEATSLKELPTFGKAKPSNMYRMFANTAIEEIPDNFGDWDFSALTYAATMFAACNNLLHIPSSLMKGLTIDSTNTYKMWTYSFNIMHHLSEAIDLPPTTKSTSNVTSTDQTNFRELCRINRFAFLKNDDGTVKTCRYRNQKIDLSDTAGYSNNNTFITLPLEFNVCYDPINNRYLETIEEVTARYNELKDNELWYAQSENTVTYDGKTLNLALLFSRYNHDSAAETAATIWKNLYSGTNTLMLKNYSGACTDGGGINNLTTEEIAVAASNGWTIALS